MNKKQSLWEKNKKLVFMMFAIPIVVAIIVIAGTVIKNKITNYQEQKAIEAKAAEQERMEEERVQAIEKALEESKYGEEYA